MPNTNISNSIPLRLNYDYDNVYSETLDGVNSYYLYHFHVFSVLTEKKLYLNFALEIFRILKNVIISEWLC